MIFRSRGRIGSFTGPWDGGQTTIPGCLTSGCRVAESACVAGPELPAGLKQSDSGPCISHRRALEGDKKYTVPTLRFSMAAPHSRTPRDVPLGHRRTRSRNQQAATGGTHEQKGLSMEAVFAHVYDVENRRIARFRQFTDTVPVVEAARAR